MLVSLLLTSKRCLQCSTACIARFERSGCVVALRFELSMKTHVSRYPSVANVFSHSF